LRRAGGGASHDRRGRGSGARKARAAHSGAGEGASRVAMQARAWGLAWYLRDARFHRKPSCEIWPSGCTQAQRGVSTQQRRRLRWMAPTRDDSWKAGLRSDATDAAVAGLCGRAVVAGLSTSGS
jgi:hypothetical protein